MPSTVFDIEWELVKPEIETINSTVRQMDETSKDVKHWTVVLWTAATGGALPAQPSAFT